MMQAKQIKYFIALLLVAGLTALAAAEDAKPGPATKPAAGDNSKPPTAPAPAPAQAQGVAGQPKVNPAIKAAVDILIAEANELDNFNQPKVNPIFTRTHPCLAQFGPEMAMPVLERMVEPFTDNEFRDTYIRWHMMAVVKKAVQSDRRLMGPLLVRLIKLMPGPLTAQFRSTGHWDFPDIANRYGQLASSGNMTVGYPPFQRPIGPPESYKYMDAATAAQVQKNLEEAATLKDKFHWIGDPAAYAWNWRINAVHEFIRVYRGELIYQLLLTGDPEMAILVMNEVDRQVKLKSGIAFDLLSYVYLAAFDKVLGLYPQNTLDQMSQILENTARGADAYVDYGNQKRNFADYAFHLVYMLKDGGGFIDTKGSDETTSESHSTYNR